MKNPNRKIYYKLASILIITLLLLIPGEMIKNLIRERENTLNEAIEEVSEKWSNKQTITGPYLTIPYYKYVKQYSDIDSTDKIVKFLSYVQILPNELNIDGVINPAKRYRGIYQVVVYESKINIGGNFNFDLKDLDIEKENLLTDKAFITLGIDDLRGIQDEVIIKWGSNQHMFNPGVITNEIVSSGINTNIELNDTSSLSVDFSLDLNLKGSEKIDFVPVGKTTNISLRSSWKNPSFSGAFLPDSRNISNTGFDAKWKILNLNRNFPQVFKERKYKVRESAFGITLLLPVDTYQKSMRTIKYSILFIGLTFLVFFFVEIMQRKFIHPIQYILIGFALIIFYTLLISISEHLKFDIAYIISAMSTLILVFIYVKAILRSTAISLIIAGILFILNGFIFVIIQLQDYSLLIGSIGLFIILALIMYFTRKIDWYNINLERK